MLKRAEMGVGTLIIFIAMLLVAAVAAGVLIQTVGSLQEKGLSTGQQARGQIATNIRVVEISATDGTTRTINDFTQIVKLAPGSDPVKLDDMIMTFNTYDKTATLTFRGAGAPLINNNSGYATWIEQELDQMRKYNQSNQVFIDWTWISTSFDFDGDFIADNATVCRNGAGICAAGYFDKYIAINLTSLDTKVYVPLYRPTGAIANLSTAGIPLGNLNTPVGSYGYINTRGTTTNAWRLNVGQLIGHLDKTLLNMDFDDDGMNDYVVINDTHVIFILSTDGQINISLGANLDLATQAIAVSTDIELGSVKYGTVEISTTTENKWEIQENATFLITPLQYGKGYFVAEYLEEGTNYVAGNIQRGDLVRLYYKAPKDVGEDEEIRINMIPKIGTPTASIFNAPSVISTQRVYLYP